jgi:hypothetical protein
MKRGIGRRAGPPPSFQDAMRRRAGIVTMPSPQCHGFAGKTMQVAVGGRRILRVRRELKRETRL